MLLVAAEGRGLSPNLGNRRGRELILPGNLGLMKYAKLDNYRAQIDRKILQRALDENDLSCRSLGSKMDFCVRLVLREITTNMLRRVLRALTYRTKSTMSRLVELGTVIKSVTKT